MAEQGALYRIELDIKDLKRQAEEVSKTIHGIGVNAEKEGNRIDGVFKKLGAAMAGYFTAQQAISFAQSIVKVRSEIESLEVSFRTLLGSEAKANALFGQIREFAVNTPMMMNDLSKGAQTLLAFNYNADKVMPILKALGDISMGDSNKFNSLTLAFAQMSSAGKLMGQDLMQMINAGFNPLAEISAKTGKSIGQLKDEMSKGAISAQMVEEAFISATSEGGKFYGMLEAQSKTMAGAISNLQGAWEDMLNAIGADAQGAFTDSVALLTNIVKHYEDFGRVLVEVIAVMGAYKAAIVINTVATSGLTAAEAAHYGWLVLVEKAQKLLNATMLKNPYALVAAAVVAIGVAIYELIRKENELSASMQAVEDVSHSFNEEIIKEQHTIDSLFAKLKVAKEGTEEYDKAKKNILDHYGKYLEGLSDEIKSLQDLEGAYNAVSKAALDSARKRARANATTAASDAMIAEQADISDDIYEILKTKFKGNALETYYQQIMSSLRGDGKKINDEFVNKFNTSRDYYNRATGDSYTITTNKLREAIASYNRALSDYEKAMAEADRRFGTEELVEETPTETPTNTETEEERKKKWEKQNNIEERLRKIEEYKKKVADAQRDAEFEITQAKIDAMEESLPKVMAQNELNYQKALADNVDREKAMLEEYRDRMQAEWENANPEFKSKNMHFDRNAITELPADEVQILYNYSDLACQAFEKANKDALNSALEDFKTYEQQRLEIERKYAVMIGALYEEDGNGSKKLREGVTQENIENIKKRMKSELRALSDDMMKNGTDYVKFFSAAISMTVSEVEKIGDVIKKDLNQKLKEGILTIDEYTRSWQEVDSVIEDVKSRQNDFLTLTSQGLQGLIDKNKELAEAKKQAAMADYAEASKNGDTQGMQSAQISMEMAGQMSSAASAASGVIAIIDAIINAINDAVQGLSDIVHTMADLAESFGEDIESTNSSWGKSIQFFDTFASASQAATDGWNSLKNGDGIGVISNVLKSWTVWIESYNKWKDKGITEDIEKQKELISDLEDAYSKLEEQVGKTYAANKEAVLNEQYLLIQKRIEVYRQLIDYEQSKKNPNSSAISEYEAAIQSLYEQMSEISNDAERVLFDSDVYSAIGTFGDALADAFMKGEDAAEAFANSARDLTRQALNNIIKQFIQSAGYIEQIEAKINEAYSDGSLTQDEIDGIIAFSESLANDFQDRYGWIENVYQKLTNDSSITASSKGIATASQESVDELNGRVTAIQGHTYELANNSRVLTANTTDILRSVRNIEDFASEIKQKVVDIEAETKDIKRAMSGLETQGINIR